MKIIGIIPARYNSTRFKGKPLALIHGKPMIWWVYNQVSKVEEFETVYVATDNHEIKEYCESNQINVLMTSEKHENHIYRIHEVSSLVDADYYVCVNGDEPMIEPNVIKRILDPIFDSDEPIDILNLMTTIKDATEVVDFSKIKIITDDNQNGIYMSRSPIPYPRGNSQFVYKKYVGVECMTKEALDYYVATKPSRLEIIEDIDHLRFIENRKRIKFIDVDSNTLSVDTPKDLLKVNELIGTNQTVV